MSDSHKLGDSIDGLVFRIAGEPDYIKFLLVERPYIRAAVECPPQVYDQDDRVDMYSSMVGNALHNDIIELEEWLDTLSPQDRAMVLAWCERAEGKPYFGRAFMRRVRKIVNEHAEELDEQQEETERHDAAVAVQDLQGTA